MQTAAQVYPQTDLFTGSTQKTLNTIEIHAVQCQYCGHYHLVDSVQFRCPDCKVFLDGPISIVYFEGEDLVLEETGEKYRYIIESKKPKYTAWDVLSHGPVSLLNQNRNWLCIVCGPTGTGKSYTSIRIAEMLSPKFNIDQIAFTIQDLLDLFDTSSNGDFIIFDEGNEWNAREAQKRQNIIFSKILAMLRFTQINVIFTLPHLGMIDINGRRLAHAYLYAVEIDRERCPPWQRDKSGVYWYNIISTRLPRANQADIPLLYKFPVIDGERISKVWFTKASDSLLEEYEAKKRRNWKARLVEAKKLAQADTDSMDYERQIQRVEKMKEKRARTPGFIPKTLEDQDLLAQILNSSS